MQVRRCTCDAALQKTAHDSVHGRVGVRGHSDPASPQGPIPAALAQEEVNGGHQQHALSRAKGAMHHTQRARTLHSNRSSSIVTQGLRGRLVSSSRD